MSDEEINGLVFRFPLVSHNIERNILVKLNVNLMTTKHSLMTSMMISHKKSKLLTSIKTHKIIAKPWESPFVIRTFFFFYYLRNLLTSEQSCGNRKKKPEKFFEKIKVEQAKKKTQIRPEDTMKMKKKK